MRSLKPARGFGRGKFVVIRRVRRRFFGLMAAAPILILSACSDQPTVDVKKDAGVSEVMQLADPDEGELIFVSRCAVCHGEAGMGSKQGPPLVHNIYRPDHHSDYSIERAVRFGVRSHHWGFGNMSPTPGLSSEDIQHLIAYIRQEQVRAGIR